MFIFICTIATPGKWQRWNFRSESQESQRWKWKLKTMLLPRGAHKISYTSIRIEYFASEDENEDENTYFM